jgi:alkanesulfonate monooxygenase SsuD/methylene tetrahydromethanopterin reductase-like flavin-dependent oxidoreductase (luciferase family)
VADTKEKAYEDPRESALTSMTGLAERVRVSASREGTTGNWQAESEQLASMTYDDWLRDKVVYGTPERVVDRLSQLIEELHLSQIVYEINFGRQIPFEQQTKCLRLITEKVFPKIR